MQELGQACPATALAVLASVGLCARSIHNWGSAAEKEKYLTDLLNGTKIGGYSALEPEAGLDTWELKTAAVEDGKGYHLSGAKNMAYNAPSADVTIITAAADSNPALFLVEKDAAGLE